MEYYSSQISQLIEQLSSLPGIGTKTAQRLAFHIIYLPKDLVEKLAYTKIKRIYKILYCPHCLTVTDRAPCKCSGNPMRNHEVMLGCDRPREVGADARPVT
mgnify:CR=1 FL=1